MAAYYGAKFAEAWRGTTVDDVKATWAEELGDYSVEELQRGVAGLKTRDWPPTLPEFLKLCRPPIEPAAAHAEACEKYPRHIDGEAVTWTRPEIFWAAQKVGAWELKNTLYEKLKSRWVDALANASRAVPPEPKKAVADKSSAWADPQVRARVSEGLRKLKLKPMPGGKLESVKRDMNFDFPIQQLAAEAELDARENQDLPI